MAVTEDLIYTIPKELVENFSGLIILFQAIGGLIILYLIFNIINIILNRKKIKR